MILIRLFAALLLAAVCWHAAIAADLVIARAVEQSSLDPLFGRTNNNYSTSGCMFERLVQDDAANQIKPGLAVTWRVVNPTTWEIKLREKVKFHDGTDFSADDVVFSLERFADPKINVNYATLGEGSYPDLFRQWLNNQWGTKIVGIPYRGGGPAAQAVAANDVQVTRFGVGNFLGLLQAGKVKALAVSAAKRSPVPPDVPTFAEVGWGDYPGQGWWGLGAPKGTPPEIVAKLSSEFQKLFSDSKFVAFLDKQAVVAAPTTPDGFAEFLKQDRKDAETLIKIANTKKTEFKE